jgi:MraZ protein
MEPEMTSGRTYFNSTFRHGVDPKRRVQIPSRWRPEESGTELTLIVWPKHKQGPCLRVLLPQQMAKMLADIDALPNDDEKKVVLKRFIGSSSAQVPLDRSGRICLPEEMAIVAGITDQAVLVGLLDKFEIWSPERYAQVKTADQVLAPEALRMME